MEHNYDPGFALGIVTAQSLTQPLTQNTLSSFHNSGTKTETVENLYKFKNLTQFFNDNDKSSCNIILINNLSNIEIYSIFVCKYFSYFIENIEIYNSINYKKKWLSKIDNKHFTKVIEININKNKQYKFISLYDLVKILKKYIYTKYYGSSFITSSYENLSKIIIYCDDNLYDNINWNNIKITGIENIIDIKIKRKDNSINVITKGSNLNLILSCNNVDKQNTISNNIKDVYMNLGIETARNVLLNELNPFCEKKYIELLVDCMTVLGTLLPVNSKGVNTINKSFLSNISYENSMKILKKQIPFGIHDKVDDITKKLILGRKPNIGTNSFRLFRKPIINITYFNIFDKDKIKINYNNKTIKINKISIIIYQNTYNKLKKINQCLYKIKEDKYNIIVNKNLFTTLKITINKYISFYSKSKNIILKINNFDHIKDIFYERIQGKGIFEIEVKNDNILLLDRFIINNNINKFNIKRINNKINTEVIISIKPLNTTNSTIKIIQN